MHYYESALAVDSECLPANRALFDYYFDSQEWDRAQPLADTLALKAMRDGDPSQRSDFYRRRGVVARMTGDLRAAGESLMMALELEPTNLEALEVLSAIAKDDPDLYDFDATYKELDRIYRKRDDAKSHLARVRIAHAVMKVREGDLDAAEKIYGEACKLAPTDFKVLSSVVELHTNMRQWKGALDAISHFLEAVSEDATELRVKALMRKAEIHADCEMDSRAALRVLEQVVELDPACQEAPYRMAQEYYLLGEFGPARSSIEQAIALAADPERTVMAEELARYYYYLGKIIEAGDEPRGAQSQYRRAAEYDPAYAPPVLALADRAANAGDSEKAERLLIDAAHAAMEQAGAQAAVPLQRGLARILLASGSRSDAIEAYRGILNVELDDGNDRVALAEIYATNALPKAISELQKVIINNIHHAPAYRLLASYYEKIGEGKRSLRVLAAMETLGFAEEQDRLVVQKSRRSLSAFELAGTLDDESRLKFLVNEASTNSIGRLWRAIASKVTTLFPPPTMGENVVPIQVVGSDSFDRVAAEMQRVFGVDCEIYVGENVPTGVAVVAYPRPIVVIDKELVEETELARRFLLGYALEGIRGGYAVLFSLGHRHRSELVSLIRSLLRPESERAQRANDFIKTLSRSDANSVEKLVGQDQEVDVDGWIDRFVCTAKRSGLVCCDDFSTATRMLARLSGEKLDVGADGTVGLGAVLSGPDLVRYFISDEYQQLREILGNPSHDTAHH